MTYPYNTAHGLGRRWQFIPLPVYLRNTARDSSGTPWVRIGRKLIGRWLGEQSASGYVTVGLRRDSCATVLLKHVKPLDGRVSVVSR